MAVLTPVPDLILASASVARTRLLTDAGVAHICDPADIDEDAVKRNWSGDAAGLAEKLALEKARVVGVRHPNALVIGSDQVLVLDDVVFDKPGSLEKVRDQLECLRGRKHCLISAVSLVQNGQVVWSHTTRATLTMRPFSDAFLDDYLDRVGSTVKNSVGAYHLEGLGAQLFEAVDGDFFTILGLPLIELLDALRRRGVLIP